MADSDISDVIRMSAIEVVALLKNKDISTRELLNELESRISTADPVVNALPTLCFERARDRQGTIPKSSILAGLPVSIEDLSNVSGVRTTQGSLVYENHVP